MKASQFWYIGAESHELKAGVVLSRKILGEWIALFRDENGKAVALLDRCLHRGSQISGGKIKNGCLQCPYHGWVYDGAGNVVQVPSEGPGASTVTRKPQKTFQVIEQDHFIYICLEESQHQPFQMPHHGESGWHTIRLQNRFQNTVTNCAENFVDVPHTVFVHPAIFRQHKYQKFGATVTRENGSVVVKYKNETSNFGIFSWFLNPSGHEIEHTDSFHMPNVTCVQYKFSPGRVFYITSQSVPITETETLVYTDLTYNYGIWTLPAAPIVRIQGQMIIDQDIKILNNQMKTIQKYGDKFMNSAADAIHIMIETIREEIAQGRDPRLLPKKVHEIEFWV